jgi:single-stranded DNA-binding protein
MNHVSLVGRLSRAPTVRFEGESQTATFTLFVTEPSRSGQPYTLYIPCTSWGKAAEACARLNAEDLVAVEGKLTWRPRKRKCGQEHADLTVSVRDVAVLSPVAQAVGSSN